MLEGQVVIWRPEHYGMLAGDQNNLKSKNSLRFSLRPFSRLTVFKFYSVTFVVFSEKCYVSNILTHKS